MKEKIKTNMEVTPYSHKLRLILDKELTDSKFTQTEILNKFMSLAVKREKENNFKDQKSKDLYFAILYDLISNTLFEK